MTELLADLDPEQQAVATALDGPVIVLAGAGTGKTRAITHRIANAVTSGAHQADQTMAVTFTVRAAHEMKLRLQRLGIDGVSVRTLHASALAMVQHFWPQAFGDQPPKVAENAEAFLTQAMQRHHVPIEKPMIRDLSNEISWTKAMRHSVQNYSEVSSGRSITAQIAATKIAEIMQTYDELLSSSHQCDLSDIVLLAAALLEDQPRITRSFHDRYQHFTVDEFQDISPAQQHLLNQWWGDRDSVCVVGDPGQAIYGFAGANSSFLTQLEARFPNATIAKLTRTYRSAPAIVHAANSFAEIPTVSQRNIVGKVEIKSAFDQRTEANEIATWISQLIGSGLAANEIAVLTRLNAQLPLIENALRGIGITASTNSASGGVDLMTIHSAKGLEWKAVAIAGLSDQLLPYQPFGIQVEEAAIAEERRLFYVALTRAADQVRISYTRDRGPSEFLSVISADSGIDIDTNTSTVTKALVKADKEVLVIKPAKCRFCSKSLVTTTEKVSMRCDGCAPHVKLDLWQQLLNWRKSQAQLEEIPEFLILTDTTLRAIAECEGIGVAYQIGVSGITSIKLENYKADIDSLFSK